MGNQTDRTESLQGPFDLLAIAAVALVMLVVSLVAALLPVWCAARVDPSEALRAE